MYKNRVIVLYEGYSTTDPDDSSIMRANCTCTLIIGRNGLKVIVDTMTPWDGSRILQSLADQQLQPDDIDIVVCTHGHSDHIGCNYLFQKAKYHFVGACPSQQDKYFNYFDDAKSFQLDEEGEITVECTPGHTLSCVSVIVRNTDLDGATVGICGDLFERKEDVQDTDLWLNAGSEDPASQRRQRLRMADICKYIVPGHGRMFLVDNEILEKLKSDVSNDS